MNLKRLRRSVLAAGIAAAVVLAPVGAAVAASPRGTVVSSVKVSHLTADQVAELGLAAGHAEHAVTGYRLQYRTVDANGRPTTASGLVVLPDAVTGPLPVVEYEHGTRNNRHEVASVTADTPDRDVTETFASAGFLAVAPDYLGLGTGPGTHPYMDVRTEVSASLDMLHAATQFARSRGLTLDHTLRLTGFSQGGQAAMGLGKAVQGGALPGWHLDAVSPISGPYDLQRTELPALVLHPGDGPGEVDPIEGVFYIAYWTVAENRLHHFYRDPSEVFRAPYAGVVEGLFDGEHSDEEIVAALPGSALLMYDVNTMTEHVVYRRPAGNEYGITNLPNSNADGSRIVYGFTELNPTNGDGPAAFYVSTPTTPNIATPLSTPYPAVGRILFMSDGVTAILQAQNGAGGQMELFAANTVNPIGQPVRVGKTLDVGESLARVYVARNTQRLIVGYSTPPSEDTRMYNIAAYGSGTETPFTTTLSYSGAPGESVDDNGQFLLYAPVEGSRRMLRIMSTRALDYSIPLMGSGSTGGVSQFRWLPRP